MFLHLSVSHSVHWGGACMAEGACMTGGKHGRGHAWQGWEGACMAGGHAWQEGVHGKGGHVWQGACMVGRHAWQGSMHGKGHVWQEGVCGRGVCTGGGMHGGMGRGVRAMHTPQTLRNMVGQCAGGMHPTGMHSY